MFRCMVDVGRVAPRRLAAVIAVFCCSLIYAGTAAALTIPFTEEFVSDSANWLNAPETAFLDFVPSGGPDGSSYASTSFSFENNVDGDTVAMFKGEDLSATLGVVASDGAFVGDWASRVSQFSAWVRHDALEPLQYFVRLAPPGNFPGAFGFGPFVAPNTWTKLTFAINDDPGSLFFFEGGSFASVLGNIANIQLGPFVPASLAGSDQVMAFDLDKPMIVPEPPSALLAWMGLAGVALLARVRRRRRHDRQSLARLGTTGSVLLPLMAPLAQGDIVTWDEPDVDRWFHQGNNSPGDKSDPSLFTAFGFAGTNHPGVGQVRSGSMLVAFDTSSDIALVEPHRYSIASIQVGLTMTPDMSITYDPTPDSLADITGGTDDAGRPIELFGVGFDNDYERVGFGSNDGQPPEFEERSALWSAAAQTEDRTYNVFPLGDDGSGSLGNVFNNPGGEGDYDFNESTEEWELVATTRDPWDTVPWAVGTVPGLSPGDSVPGNSVFMFDIDLQLPGVTEYFQEALADGSLAVFVSSMHDLEGFHTGGSPNPFPRFYAKEHLAVQLELQSAATLQIDYTLLPPDVLGDMDCDGDVDFDDIDDFVLGLNNPAAYEAQYGIPSTVKGDLDSDGDQDFDDIGGFVDVLSPGAHVGLTSVPEPAGLAYLISGTAGVLGLRVASRFGGALPRRHRNMDEACRAGAQRATLHLGA